MSDKEIFIACPHCQRRNRVPVSRSGESGRCGACKQALFCGRPLDLNQAGFAAQLAADLPLVVDFWAPWCGPCRQFAPVFEAAAAELEPRCRFGKLNSEAHPELAQRYAIHSIPTLVVFRGGQEADRIAGALSPQQLRRWVSRHL